MKELVEWSESFNFYFLVLKLIFCWLLSNGACICFFSILCFIIYRILSLIIFFLSFSDFKFSFSYPRLKCYGGITGIFIDSLWIFLSSKFLSDWSSFNRNSSFFKLKISQFSSSKNIFLLCKLFESHRSYFLIGLLLRSIFYKTS